MSKTLTIGKPKDSQGVFVVLADLERDLNRVLGKTLSVPAGQIGGTAASPTVLGIRESGGTLLTFGAIADGQTLKRVGTTIVGV